MQITINGEAKTLPENSTIATLIDIFAIDIRKVAIEANLTIIPKSLYAETLLNEGDAIEIVQFIGGG
jgi:sulfur carrier protein